MRGRDQRLVRLPLRGPGRARAGVRDRAAARRRPARRRSASATRPGWPTRVQVREFFEQRASELPGQSSSPRTSTTRAGRAWRTCSPRSRPAVDSFESSFGELGGCPVPPGATGNIATEDLVWMLRRDGHRDRGRPAGADRLHAAAAARPAAARSAATRWSPGPIDWHALMFERVLIANRGEIARRGSRAR